MMKLISLRHGPWLLVTIGAFVWGLSSSESSSSGKVQARKTDQKISSSPRGNENRAQRRIDSLGTRSTEDGKEREIKGWFAGGMTEVQNESLLDGAIKFGTPVERRLALDRILQGIQSAEISFADALAIREAMLARGADEEGKLLDYAIGAYMSEEVMAHLDELPSEERLGFLKGMIPGMASANPAEAIGLFESLDPKMQAQLRPRFLEGLVDNDIRMATDYLYDSSDLENYHWRPMAELTREVVKEEGLKSALDWADELPQGAQRRDAWSSAYAVWASKDPVAAGESINALPDGVDRNLAINGFVSAHVYRDGPLAMDWAHSISNPGLREAAMVRIGTQFYQKDPESATQWYASSGWSPSSWAKVTNSAKR